MFFHASGTPGIQTLLPHVSNHGEPLVYLTSKRENALVYLSNAVERHCRSIGYQPAQPYYKWCSYGFTQEGLLQLEEYWPNAFWETYAGVSGYLYAISQAPRAEAMSDIPFAFTSSAPVPVTHCEYIPDAYDALCQAARDGLIAIKTFEELSPRMLKWIQSTICQEYQRSLGCDNGYKEFLKAKFPYICRDE